MRYKYRAPEALERDWIEGRQSSPEKMRRELAPHVERLLDLSDSEDTIAVQGRVSDYKSWLMARTAEVATDAGLEVAAFTPQRTNRESTIDKLEDVFDAEYLEHPSRFDLCAWDDWHETVGRVDHRTCQAINCPYWLETDEDINDRTGRELSAHRTRHGATKLDRQTMKDMGENQHMCPYQLYESARSNSATSGSVNVATYAKLFEEAVIAEDDPLDCDLALLDEAHTIAADPDFVDDTVEPEHVNDALRTLMTWLENQPQQWAEMQAREVGTLAGAVANWFQNSEERHVDPDEIFEVDTLTLADSFDTLETIDSRLIQMMNRHIAMDEWERADEISEPYRAVKTIRSFLSKVNSYREGDFDFVHNRYTERGDEVNEMAFREVEAPTDGATPHDVFELWQERGTHPAVRERWGPLIDRHIEALWEGRSIYTHNPVVGAPVRPIERLREISGADTVVTFSATHNDLSDPDRDPDENRETRHDLLVAPVQLRASSRGPSDYDGNTAATPSTPWFRDLVETAINETGDNVAVVPINFNNRRKWDGLPVAPIPDDDGDDQLGIVPHSRGSIGEKHIEALDVDAVMCGIQVQSPADTARRLMVLWEMLCGESDIEPGEVLDRSWRLLAQHAVSGTIQAGGRFDWDAPNLVFDHPDLFELAGFDVRSAREDDGGFVGEFVRLFNDVDRDWRNSRDGVRARRIVDYLSSSESKRATLHAAIEEYEHRHGVESAEARSALERAVRRGDIEADEQSGTIQLTQT